MRILAGENVDREIIVQLREFGHDVEWAGESYQSDTDPSLLRLATDDRRTLVTFDRDFGELVHRFGMPSPYGVVYFRVHPDVPQTVSVDFTVRTVTMWEQ